MDFKYYAVRVGRRPGIYLHSRACKVQVDGYPNNDSKVFKTLKEAREYLAAGNSESRTEMPFGEHVEKPGNDGQASRPDTIVFACTVREEGSQGATGQRAEPFDFNPSANVTHVAHGIIITPHPAEVNRYSFNAGFLPQHFATVGIPPNLTVIQGVYGYPQLLPNNSSYDWGYTGNGNESTGIPDDAQFYPNNSLDISGCTGNRNTSWDNPANPANSWNATGDHRLWYDDSVHNSNDDRSGCEPHSSIISGNENSTAYPDLPGPSADDSNPDEYTPSDQEPSGDVTAPTINSVAPASSDLNVQPLNDPTVAVYIKGTADEKEGQAGIGVYFGKDDYRNFGMEMSSYPKNHQRAELMALKWALLNVSIDTPVEVFSNNTYVSDCIKNKAPKWVKNGWKNSKGRTIHSIKLLKHVLAIMKIRGALPTVLSYIPSDKKDPSIEEAWTMAREATRT